MDVRAVRGYDGTRSHEAVWNVAVGEVARRDGYVVYRCHLPPLLGHVLLTRRASQTTPRSLLVVAVQSWFRRSQVEDERERRVRAILMPLLRLFLPSRRDDTLTLAHVFHLAACDASDVRLDRLDICLARDRLLRRARGLLEARALRDVDKAADTAATLRVDGHGVLVHLERRCEELDRLLELLPAPAELLSFIAPYIVELARALCRLHAHPIRPICARRTVSIDVVPQGLFCLVYNLYQRPSRRGLKRFELVIGTPFRKTLVLHITHIHRLEGATSPHSVHVGNGGKSQSRPSSLEG